MALYVQTNVSSLNAQRKLTNSTNALNVSYQRLASGFRINSSKDDAAGLQISDRLTAQINGLNQGNRNANDGIALAQTVEGALDETTVMLQRIRVLCVQAANGTNTMSDRKALQEEVTQLCAEIGRIGRKTTFAGAQVLDGKPAAGDNSLLSPNDGKIIFQVGANAHDTLDLDLSKGFTFSGIMTGTQLIDGKAANFNVIQPANPAGGVKAGQLVEGKADANSGLVASWVAKKDNPTHPGNTKDDWEKNVRFSVCTAESAQASLSQIDKYINYVDSKRATLGAIQNRMESTIRNQSSISENESDARSRIRDTDFAEETARLTQNNIIQQASQTILSQANQRPTIALNLLSN